MTLNLSDVTSFIAIFLFLVVTVFLLSHRASYRAGTWLLAVFLISKSLCFLNGLLFRFADQLAPTYPHVYHWGFSFEFLLGPALYLYTRALVSGGFRPRPRHLLHLIPFFAHVLFMVVRFHRFDAATKTRSILQGPLLTAVDQQWLDTFIFVYFLVYGLAAVRVFFLHRQRIRDVYSQIETRRLAWLGSLLFYFLAIWVVSYANLTWHFLHPETLLIPWVVFDLLLLSFATMIVFFALRQPALFTEEGARIEPRKDTKPRLPEPDRERLLTRLTHSMQTERPYLNPDVTLADLARCSGVPPRDLTYLLRESLGTCFYDYINRHRIEEAKRLLTQNGNGRSNVLDILQRAGFNSKSVFNTAFKRHTGQTPTEYRRAQQTVN